MVLDVEPATAQRLAEVGDFFCRLPVLETLGGVGCFANASIDLALEPQFWIVDHERSTHENVEERGDVFTMYALDLRGNRLLEAGRQFRDLRIGRGGGFVLRHVKEHEIVVVWERDHEPRRRERAPAQEVAHCLAGGLEHAVEFLPAVNLFDFGVAVEVEVEDDDLAPVLNRLPYAIDCCGDSRKPRQRVTQKLMIVHAQRAGVAVEAPEGAYGATNFTFRSTVAASRESSNGFSTKSSAPVCKACLLFTQSSRAVTITTRTFRPSVGCCLISRQTCHPSRPGIITSRRTRAGLTSSNAFSASSPLYATVMGYPRASR